MAEWSKAVDLSSITLKFAGSNPAASKPYFLIFLGKHHIWENH